MVQLSARRDVGFNHFIGRRSALNKACPKKLKRAWVKSPFCKMGRSHFEKFCESLRDGLRLESEARDPEPSVAHGVSSIRPLKDFCGHRA